MAPNKSPYFSIHAVDFLCGTQVMSLKECGRLIMDACGALDSGDGDFFERIPFFGRPVFFKGNPLYISPPVRREVYDRDGRKCKHCGTNERLSIDHIIARINGGTDDPSNLQTLCMPCNRRKGTR